jgi:hypothetical protein
MKAETEGFYETSVNFYNSARRNIPYDSGKLNTNRNFLSSCLSMFYLNLFLLFHLFVQCYSILIHSSYRFYSVRSVPAHNSHFIRHFSLTAVSLLTIPTSLDTFHSLHLQSFLPTYFFRMLVDYSSFIFLCIICLLPALLLVFISISF